MNESASKAVGGNRATVWIERAALLAIAIGLAVGCMYLLFSTFMQYDDEGYVLIALRQLQAGQPLYEAVFSQYGPGFSALYNLLARVLDFEWTNTTARILTAVHWFLAAGLCADLVRRRTGSIAAAALVLAGTVKFLWVMVSEPGHPGGSIIFFVSLAAWLGSRRDPTQNLKTAFVLGGIVALLLLTKINVGVLLGFSVVVWFGLRLRQPRLSRLVALVLALAAVVLPWLLMRPLLTEGWVRLFASLASVAGFSLIVSLDALKEPPLRGRSVAAVIGGGLIAAGLIVAWTLQHGTSWKWLWEGVISGPLHHPLVYSLSPNWRPGTLLVSGAALALTVWHVNRPQHRIARRIIFSVRVVAVVLTAACLVDVMPMTTAGFTLSYGVSLAPLFALRLAPSDVRGGARAARWLATLLVWQSLHAFPIAGSQINWGTFLWLPLIVVGVYDGYLAFAPAWTARQRRHSALLAVTVSYAVALGITAQRLVQGRDNFHAGEKLGVPGAETLVLPEDYVHAMRTVAANARVHGGLLFSLPGIFSLNLWSGRPTPTAQNVTHWFSLLRVDQQADIAKKLVDDPKAIVVIQQGILQYLIEKGDFKGGGLSDFIANNFENTFFVGGYGFWVRNGRKIAVVDAAEIIPPVGTAPAHLTVCLQRPSALPQSITVFHVAGAVRVPLLKVDQTNGAIAVTELDETGVARGPARSMAWGSSIDAAQITRLDLELPSFAWPKVPLLVSGADAKGTISWFAPVIYRPR